MRYKDCLLQAESLTRDAPNCSRVHPPRLAPGSSVGSVMLLIHIQGRSGHTEEGRAPGSPTALLTGAHAPRESRACLPLLEVPAFAYNGGLPSNGGGRHLAPPRWVVVKGPAPSRPASGSASLFEGLRGEPGLSASSEQVKVWVTQLVPVHDVSRRGGKGPSSACSGAFSCLGLLEGGLRLGPFPSFLGEGVGWGGLCWQRPRRCQILALGAHSWKSQPLGH